MRDTGSRFLAGWRTASPLRRTAIAINFSIAVAIVVVLATNESANRFLDSVPDPIRILFTAGLTIWLIEFNRRRRPTPASSIDPRPPVKKPADAPADDA